MVCSSYSYCRTAATLQLNPIFPHQQQLDESRRADLKAYPKRRQREKLPDPKLSVLVGESFVGEEQISNRPNPAACW
jgi:hypothetical protein